MFQKTMNFFNKKMCVIKKLIAEFFTTSKSTNGWLIAPFIDEEGRVL
jgi:hypothetical protein